MTNREKQIFYLVIKKKKKNFAPGMNFMCTWMKKGKKLSAFQLMACFFQGVQNNLGVQYNKKYSIDEIEEIILIEIGKRPKFYLGFYPEAENKKTVVGNCQGILHNQVICFNNC